MIAEISDLYNRACLRFRRHSGSFLLCFYSVDIIDCCFFFFFQAEDGIRYYKVTGVQTCALPILSGHRPRHDTGRQPQPDVLGPTAATKSPGRSEIAREDRVAGSVIVTLAAATEIGRASCRERV